MKLEDQNLVATRGKLVANV